MANKFIKARAPEISAKTAPLPPEKCQVSSCGNETSIAMMRVYNNWTKKTEVNCVGGMDNGRDKKKRDYGYKNGNLITMNEQFEFIDWITRCADCYMLDLAGHKKRAIDFAKEEAERRAESEI